MRSFVKGKVSVQQVFQENKYDYPYHYIPKWDGYKFSQTKNISWGYQYLSYLNFVTEKVGQIGFKSLLDVGCGDGRFLYELCQKSTAYQLVGLDYSQRAIDFANIIMADTQVECVCGDIRDGNIFDKKFSIITLIETLEHIKLDEIKEFLRGIYNYLAEGGSLIITVPSKNMNLKKTHYQHFDLQSLKNTLSPMFTVTDVSYLNHKYSFSSKLIKKLLTNKLFILKHKGMLRFIYNYYINHLLFTDAINCSRIAATCKKSTKSVRGKDE